MTNAMQNEAKAGLAVILKPLVFSRGISSRLWEFDCWKHLEYSKRNHNHCNAFEPRDYTPHQQLRYYAHSWAKSIILRKRDIQACIAPLSSSSSRECSESMILVTWQPLFHSAISGEYGAWDMSLNLLSSLICTDLVELWGFVLSMSRSTMYYETMYVVGILLNQCPWRTRATQIVEKSTQSTKVSSLLRSCPAQEPTRSMVVNIVNWSGSTKPNWASVSARSSRRAGITQDQFVVAIEKTWRLDR
jgi:hypothetical protein